MTDCALDAKPNAKGSCLTSEHINLLSDYAIDIRAVIDKCDDDECVITSVEAPSDVKGKVRREALKVPVQKISHNYWLNNTEIDNVMSQFRIRYKGFAHGFIHMCDLQAFEPSNLNAFDYPVFSVHDTDFAEEFRHSMTALKKIDRPNASFMPKLSTHGDSPLTSYGIVCNTDSSKGSGQHWFSVFISTDQVDPDDSSKPWIRIELFNSAGGGCSYKAFNEFWQRTAIAIANATGLRCTFDTITTIQHQSSDTGNCGSYSLFYIYARLNHCMPGEFDNPKKPITDQSMLKFRSICFKVDDTTSAFVL